ncbi:transposase [Acidiphilium sp. AL]|uniref:transposase n=1 Tax=Acidiphilium sp. AL TaxID=2871704 RepID=UPI0021CB59F4|nr:transposase [Acidiphilium sp. AL]MCU4160505.1 transposase [Acidiphilium sp. AL]
MRNQIGQIDALPQDADAMRALLLTVMADRDGIIAAHENIAAEHAQVLVQRDELVEQNAALAEQNERLRHLLLKLKRLQFGAKSERLPEAQLQLGLEELETAIAQVEAEGETRDPRLKREGVARRRASRGALPEHLPRIEVVLTPEDTYGMHTSLCGKESTRKNFAEARLKYMI